MRANRSSPATKAARTPPAGDATPDTLYDARRDLYYRKPALRGWQHLIWFAVSLLTGTLLVIHTHGAVRLVAVAIYVSAVSGLFGTSALYHRGSWSSAWSQRLQRLDHLMIFLLIAGTTTPAFAVAEPDRYGLICVVLIWALTLIAMTIHLTWMDAPEKLVGGTFVALGWVACLAIPALWVHAGVVPAVLIVIGGVLYTAGALHYHHRWPDPFPSVFGYHEVFHAYVCAAATVQYVAIAIFITS